MVHVDICTRYSVILQSLSAEESRPLSSTSTGTLETGEVDELDVMCVEM